MRVFMERWNWSEIIQSSFFASVDVMEWSRWCRWWWRRLMTKATPTAEETRTRHHQRHIHIINLWSEISPFPSISCRSIDRSFRPASWGRWHGDYWPYRNWILMLWNYGICFKVVLQLIISSLFCSFQQPKLTHSFHFRAVHDMFGIDQTQATTIGYLIWQKF